MNISVEKLVACGLSRGEADDWSAQLQDWAAVHDEQLRWQKITTQLLTPSVPFAVHELLYQENYAQHRQQQLPCPAWIPQAEEVAGTHLAEWMNALGLSTYEELHAWSVAQPEEFAAKLSDALSLRFHSPAINYCDTSSGIENARWYSQATLNIVESCFQADDDAPAVISGNDENDLEVLSYAGLKALTARVANGLAELCIKPGDRVAISMPMTAEAVAAFLGIIAAGCAAVTIADSFSATEMAVRLKITQPKCIFVQDEIIRNGKAHPLFEKIAAQEQMPAIVFRAGARGRIKLRSGDLEWEDFLSADNVLCCVPRSPEHETTILFSSGTTGQPKGIPWDHTTPIKSASDAYFHHDVHPSDILCWPTNLGWMMGPWLVYAALINKATLALSSSIPSGRTFCEFVEQAGVTILGLVPSIVSEWRKHDHPADLDWKSLRLFSSTGECSNPNDMLWLMSRAGYRPVIEYCGGTETGGGYITGILTKPAVPGAFSAKAMGFSWLLMNDEFERSLVGEVFFEPPALGLSTRLLNRDHDEVYYADIPPGPRQQVLRRHGDQIEELAGGHYRALGRIDDAMNLSGIKVSCVQIEELLTQHTAVRELAAISVPPPGGGPEQLVIYAVLQAEVNLRELQKEMQQDLKTRLNPVFKIQAVESIERLPRTASNKVMRRKLRNLYLGNPQV
jgi:acetyl-CoA synthetase